MKFRKFLSAVLSALLVLTTCFPTSALADAADSDENDSAAAEEETETGSDAYIDELLDENETETDTATEEEAEEALEEGVEGMPSTEESEEDTDDESGNSEVEEELESMSLDELLSTTSRTINLESYAGSSRYETAVEVAEAAYPDGVSSKTAIIVNGSSDKWADALSASSLAGLVDGPILYTKKGSLPDETADALEDFGITTAIIVGGTKTVSSSVATELESICSTVTRLQGNDRYATQLAVYEYGESVGTWSSTVIVATGSSYYDALSASALAFNEDMPIFLSNSSTVLNDSQLAALAGSGVEEFVIVGGKSSVPSSAEGILAAVASSSTGTYSSDCVVRKYGDTRYETSWYISKWAVDQGYLKWNYTGMASGSNPVDALCACVLQGTTGSPLILISNSDFFAVEKLASKNPSKARVFGGTSTITQISRNEIAMTLGYDLSTIQGFKVYVDAGHGYNNTGNGVYDSGATGNGYKEAELTAELAEMVAEELRDDGYEVFLNDDGGPYKLRHEEAIEQDCNVIISIHFNAGGGSGSMTLIHEYNACEYSEYVAEIMQDYLVQGTGLHDYGVRTQEVAILGGELPAALLEVCFIDNSSDMSTYISRKSTVAAKIVAGIESL